MQSHVVEQTHCCQIKLDYISSSFCGPHAASDDQFTDEWRNCAILWPNVVQKNISPLAFNNTLSDRTKYFHSSAMTQYKLEMHDWSPEYFTFMLH